MAGFAHPSARAIAWVFGATAALLSSCAEKGPAPLATSGSRLGEWVVVGHRLPGVSAMTDAEATAWHGRVIRYATSEAVSGEDICQRPVYKQTEAPADHFLAVEYHIRGADLGLADSQNLHLHVTDVFCGEDAWTVMGGRVFWVSLVRGYAVWDGAFFELRPAGGK